MKKILMIVALISTLLLSAKGNKVDFLNGWATKGNVKVVSLSGWWGGNSATVGKGGGTISQSVPVSDGIDYAMEFFCQGNGAFTLSQPETGYSETIVCNSADMQSHFFINQHLFSTGYLNISVQLNQGDYADFFCFYPVDPIVGGSCPPSLVNNYGFGD